MTTTYYELLTLSPSGWTVTQYPTRTALMDALSDTAPDPNVRVREVAVTEVDVFAPGTE